MELNWSTFLIEIVNFAILVWILKHFFYAPVMTVIERRRKAIDDTLAEAEAKRAEAGQIEEKYRARLEEWEEEKRRMRQAMQKEIDEERERQWRELKSSLENERMKAQVLEQRFLEEERRKNEEEAVAQAGEFAGKLLSRLSGPDLETRIYALLMEDLPKLPGDCCESLRNVHGEDHVPVRVASAYRLTEEFRNGLKRALDDLAGKRVECEFVEDKALIAGLRINIGPLVLRANLQDELRFFVEAACAQD